MDTLQAVILAIIEGITEFLPVSSTGHMILASTYFGIEHDEFTKLFTIVINLEPYFLFWFYILNDFFKLSIFTLKFL
jgi:undecaprenyl-diphosphatase